MRAESLFGGRVREAVLVTLAGTSKPLTAYRVAKVADASPIQVLSILKTLPSGVVRREREGWVLVNESLRRFLRDGESRRDAERRAEKNELLVRLGMTPSRTRGRR